MSASTRRVAVVTGAAGDIGRVIARVLSAQTTVVAVDVVPDAPFETNSGLSYERASVTDDAGVKALAKQVLDQFGRTDILVNCAGGFKEKRDLWDLSLDEWNHILSINLTGTFICTRHFSQAMRAQKFGRIVNISSTAARMPETVSVAAYAAAKAGVLGFTKHAAKELGPYGITVNAISPGTMQTPRLLRIRGPEELKQIADRTPVRRLGIPEDIARAVAFLCADDAGYITGATLDVNGGRIMV